MEDRRIRGEGAGISFREIARRKGKHHVVVDIFELFMYWHLPGGGLEYKYPGETSAKDKGE